MTCKGIAIELNINCYFNSSGELGKDLLLSLTREKDQLKSRADNDAENKTSATDHADEGEVALIGDCDRISDNNVFGVGKHILATMTKVAPQVTSRGDKPKVPSTDVVPPD